MHLTTFILVMLFLDVNSKRHTGYRALRTVLLPFMYWYYIPHSWETGDARFEPANVAVKALCLTTWLIPNKRTYPDLNWNNWICNPPHYHLCYRFIIIHSKLYKILSPSTYIYLSAIFSVNEKIRLSYR